MAAYYHVHESNGQAGDEWPCRSKVLQDTEFVIIDDGSEKRAEPIAKEFSNKMNIKLFYRELKDDINPAVAINTAVKLASHENIVLTSSDVMPLTPILSQLSRYTFSSNDYVLANCFNVSKVVQEKINALDVNSGTYTKDITTLIPFNQSGSAGPGYDCWYSHSKYRSAPLYFMALMRKEFFWAIGGIDEEFRYGTAYEDTEFCSRLVKHKANILFLLESLALHQYHYDNSINQEPEKWNRNRDIYFRKVEQ